MRSRKKTAARILVFVLPGLAVSAYFLRGWIEAWAGGFPRCPFRALTGLLCPACGNTHSVLALLKLDPLTALSYNAVPLALGLLGLLFYGELVCFAFYKPVKLVPRSNGFVYTLLGLFLVYAVARNFLPYPGS